MVRRISEKLKLDTDFIMGEFKTDRTEVKIEEVVKEVSKNTQHQEVKPLHPLSFGIFILVSGILGLLASSFIVNIFSDSFQDQTPEKILLKKN